MERRPRPCLDPQPGGLFPPLRPRARAAICRSRTSRSSIWKAPAATGITPPTTSRSTRCCWRKRPAAGRSACSGRAPTRCRMRRSVRRWRSRSKPISMRKARSSAGATASGATATPRGRGARRSPRLLAATELAKPFPRTIATNPPQANGGGADRNSVPLYDFPSWQIECHRLLTMPIRTSALRTLGAQGNVFAIECLSRRTRRRARRGSGRLPAAAFDGSAGEGRDPRRRRPRQLEAGEARRHRLWHRLCAIQEHRRLLRRGRRGRGRRGHPRQAADHRGRCRRGHQSRRRDQPDRGRRDPGHQLGAEGARSLRPRSASPATAGPTIRSCASARCRRSRSN